MNLIIYNQHILELFLNEYISMEIEHSQLSFWNWLYREFV